MFHDEAAVCQGKLRGRRYRKLNSALVTRNSSLGIGASSVPWNCEAALKNSWPHLSRPLRKSSQSQMPDSFPQAAEAP